MRTTSLFERPLRWAWAGLLVTTACSDPVAIRPEFARTGASSLSVTGTNPSGAPRDTTLDVHVLGTGFDAGSTARFLLNGSDDPRVHVNRSTYVTSKDLIANVTITADALVDTYDVAVRTSGGKQGIGTESVTIDLFQVLALEVLDAPAGGSNVSGVSPNGLIAGSISSSCVVGFAPALWNRLGVLTALPALPGTCGGSASDVNGAGVVVGSAYIGSSTSVSVRWLPSGGSYIVEALPPLPNGSDAGAWAINEAGLVLGVNAASVWSETSGWLLLSRPSGATVCLAKGINDVGAIAGQCAIGGVYVLVYWASPTAAPATLPVPTGASNPSVRGINDAGAIVGSASFVTGKARYFRAIQWVPAGGSWTATILTDLGAGASALAINDAGQVVGCVYYGAGSNAYCRPALWEASGALRELDGDNGVSEAVGISEPTDGLVIGGYIRQGNGGGSRLAVRWRP